MKNQKAQFKVLQIGLLIFLFGVNDIFSQSNEFNSIRTGIGIGINEGKRETGSGLVYSIGWQKSFGKKHKIRINPNMILGEFYPVGITDVRDQFYRITSLGINVHYDLIRYRAFSIVVTGGGFINYSRGLLGIGGMPELRSTENEYFHTIYFGGNASLGLRINPKKSKLAYELRPVNIHLGNKNFILGYMMFGIDFKLKN